MIPEPIVSRDKVFQGEIKEIKKKPWGRFASTVVEEVGIVTFTLDSKVWNEVDDPVTGEIVELTKLRLVRGRWRSFLVSRIKP